MRVTCVLVVVFGVFKASALSIDGGFSCDGFNINEGCGNSFPPTAIQSPIIDAFQYRLFDILAKQTRDSAKAAIKPQIRKEFYSVSPIKRFSQPSSPLTQNIPFTGARNFQLPALQFFPSSSITSGPFSEAQPTQIERTGNGIFSTNRAGSVNYERTIGGALGGGSYPEVLNESFLGNSNGAVAEIGSSFVGNGGCLEHDCAQLTGPSAFERGIINRYSNQGY